MSGHALMIWSLFLDFSLKALIFMTFSFEFYTVSHLIYRIDTFTTGYYMYFKFLTHIIPKTATSVNITNITYKYA